MIEGEPGIGKSEMVVELLPSLGINQARLTDTYELDKPRRVKMMGRASAVRVIKDTRRKKKLKKKIKSMIMIILKKTVLT